MEDKAANIIREQIEFLKEELKREIPLNMDSNLQPEAARKIADLQAATWQQILDLMNKLNGLEPENDDRQYYRQLLEKIMIDRSALDAAREAVSEMDDDDNKQSTIETAVNLYEMTKQRIAEKLLEKLG